jgi:hypothetical protein
MRVLCLFHSHMQKGNFWEFDNCISDNFMLVFLGQSVNFVLFLTVRYFIVIGSFFLKFCSLNLPAR